MSKYTIKKVPCMQGTFLIAETLFFGRKDNHNEKIFRLINYKKYNSFKTFSCLIKKLFKFLSKNSYNNLKDMNLDSF